jgi:hypothetical protein
MAQYNENSEFQSSNARGMTDEVKDRARKAYDTARDVGGQAMERTSEATRAVADTARQHPIGTLVVVAGLAFAVGALWKMRSDSRRSQIDSLMSQLSDFAQRQRSQFWR